MQNAYPQTGTVFIVLVGPERLDGFFSAVVRRDHSGAKHLSDLQYLTNGL